MTRSQFTHSWFHN